MRRETASGARGGRWSRAVLSSIAALAVWLCLQLPAGGSAAGPGPDTHRSAAIRIALTTSTSAADVATSVASPAVAGGSARDGALVPGRPLSLPFPRVAVWWPDTWRQSLSRIARYDYVALGQWDRDNVAKLRQRNRDLIALVSTNACELGYRGGGPEENAAVRDIPGDWFLTQVGSTLSRAVTAEATTLRVGAVRTTDARGRTIRLFVPGDTALIGEEIVRVRSVDAGSRTLTVQRGFVRPAAPHGAGERIAALITFWPGTWVLDLSTYCPRAAAASSAGPETWGEYNARRGAALVGDPVWDGLLVDRSDGDESRLLGSSTARSIDPERSNRLPTDGYAAFDAAWNQGLRAYEQRLRALVGDDRLIFTNWGYPHYDLLNGTNFEGFPAEDGTAYGVPWRLTVFGPWRFGSYVDWLKRSRQPNLSTIQTYHDDGCPDANDDGQYANPARRKGFRPDYRKMRFGLCTALLGDGFFSYEINTQGHGSLALLWFDEYDNAGRRRGYLGRPLRRARRAVGLPTTKVLNKGGRFDTSADRRRWRFWTDTEAGYAGRAVLDRTVKKRGRASLRIEVTSAAGADWQAALMHRYVRVRKGRDYTLSFWARADTPRQISAIVQQAGGRWRERIGFGSVQLSTRWKRYIVCAPSRASDRKAQFQLQLGQSEGTVWLDDVRLQTGNTEIWRRDFQGGVAIVNAGSRTRVVPLRGRYKRIKGRQVKSINNGKWTRRVKLRPRDGIILLRR